MSLTFNFKPPKFRGRATEDIDAFLAKLNAYFDKQTTKVADNERAYLVIQCMEESALGWVKTQLERYPTKLIASDGAWATYADFQKYLRMMHKRYYDPTRNAENNLMHIEQQGKSILSYNKGFSEIMARLNRQVWTDGVLLAQYRRGLDKRIENILVGQIGSTSWKLTDWMDNAIHVEREKYYIRHANDRYVPQDMEQGRTKESQYVPMDVDVNKRTLKWSKPRKHGKKKGYRKKDSKNTDRSCYKCGQPGHFAKNCRVSNHRNKGDHKNKTKTFNRKALNETASDEEEDSPGATIKEIDDDSDF